MSANSQTSETSFAIVCGWLTTPLFLITSIFTLCLWHPAIALSRFAMEHRISTPWIHDWFIAIGNRILQYCFFLTGGNLIFKNVDNLPSHGQCIIVSNHQSLFDIPILIWLLRGRNAKFIAKKSLGQGLPSASYVLRTNGHGLIDRGNAAQASEEIRRVAAAARIASGTVVIFPEGTRARNGVAKPFKPGGFKLLLAEMPEAVIVPVAICGAWRIMRFGFLPVPFGVKVTCTVFPKILRTENSTEEIIAKCQQVITEAVAAY